MNPIFIHIPKCGGTTIRKTLKTEKPIWEVHGCCQEIHDEIGSIEFGNAKKFTVIRNPFDRLVSWFEHHRRTNSGQEYYDCNFKTWIQRGCPHHFCESPFFGKRTGCLYPAYLLTPVSQRLFLEVDGSIPSDLEIFRLEEIRDWWPSLAKSFGFEGASIQRLNQNHRRKPDYRSYYDAETIQIASRLCESDLPFFDYAF